MQLTCLKIMNIHSLLDIWLTVMMKHIFNSSFVFVFIGIHPFVPFDDDNLIDQYDICAIWPMNQNGNYRKFLSFFLNKIFVFIIFVDYHYISHFLLASCRISFITFSKQTNKQIKSKLIVSVVVGFSFLIRHSFHHDYDDESNRVRVI